MEKKIKDMVKKVGERKTEISELAGEKKQLMKRLEGEGCTTVAEAKKVITRENAKVKKLDGEIADGVAELEEKYDWE